MSVTSLSPEVITRGREQQSADAEAASAAAAAYQERREQLGQRLDVLLREAEVEPPVQPEESTVLLNMCMGDTPRTGDESEYRFVILTPEVRGRTERDVVLNHLFNMLRGKIVDA